MNIRKLAKVLIAVQLGLTASGVTAEPNDKKALPIKVTLLMHRQLCR